MHNDVLLWSAQMHISTLATGTVTNWVFKIVLTACMLQVVLSEHSEMRASPCLGRSDETPVVLLALPTPGLLARGCPM